MGILIHFSGAVKSGDGYRGADPVMFALGTRSTLSRACVKSVFFDGGLSISELVA
jgi:hypothetical protein